MLRSLSIRNIVLIESLDLDLSQGLCVLTGETGAGKSILLDSLSLILGAKADTGLIRKHNGVVADKASVTAYFELPKDHSVYDILRQSDLDIDPGEDLIIRRVLSADGRNKIYMNDLPISLNILKQIGDVLIEIHGQYDNRGLLDPAQHIRILDQYVAASQPEFTHIFNDMRQAWQDWKAAQKTLNDLQASIAKDQEQEEFLRSCLQELEDLDPQEGEEETLSQKREALKYHEHILKAYQDALEHIEQAESHVAQSYRAIDKQGDKIGASAQVILQALDRSSSEIQEAMAATQSGLADVNNDDDTLENVDDRLFALRAAARRHHCLVDDLFSKRNDIAASLEKLNNQESDLGLLKDQVKKYAEIYNEKSTIIHSLRREVAQNLDAKIMDELAPLKLDKARFITQVESVDEKLWSRDGQDNVRFEIATNPGMPSGPLHKVASGGEMARVMLAIKVVLGAQLKDDLTMIFDEVDTGIGGATADAVGDRLARLGQDRQVMVVTHSPQVAAKANHHMIVMKEMTGQSGGDKGESAIDESAKEQSSRDLSMVTRVVTLSNDNDRREEIARMLAGAHITDEARAAAQKLLAR